MSDQDKIDLADRIMAGEEPEIEPVRQRAVTDLTDDERKKIAEELAGAVRKNEDGTITLQIPVVEYDDGKDKTEKKMETVADPDKDTELDPGELGNPFIPVLPNLEDPEAPGTLGPPTGNPFIPGTQTDGDTSGGNPFVPGVESTAKDKSDPDWFAKRKDVTCLDVPGVGRVCGKVKMV